VRERNRERAQEHQSRRAGHGEDGGELVGALSRLFMALWGILGGSRIPTRVPAGQFSLCDNGPVVMARDLARTRAGCRPSRSPKPRCNREAFVQVPADVRTWRKMRGRCEVFASRKRETRVHNFSPNGCTCSCCLFSSLTSSIHNLDTTCTGVITSRPSL
jgi:hypothetical protein